MAALAPEAIATLGPFTITNTLIGTLIVDAILISFIFYTRKRITTIPGKFQGAVESLFAYFYDAGEEMAQKRIQFIFPWVMTFFLFIVTANFLGLMPGIGSIGIVKNELNEAAQEAAHEPATDTHAEPTQTTAANTHATEDNHETESTATAVTETHATTAATAHEEEHLVTLVRPPTSDLNAALALATISLVVTHALSIKYTGFKDYIHRFFSFNPILLFVGLLELVSEFIKIISLSFRLFGNIYAGEVVLSTISGLFAFLAPLPFLLLESIVAIVQALVFAMLTMVFMTVLTERHLDENHD